MLFSVKMRAAKGGAHENGGRHISGAERILNDKGLERTVLGMLDRARKHQRGQADFISIKIEEVKKEDIVYKPLLAMENFEAKNVAEGHTAALQELENAGVARAAAQKGIKALLELSDSLRGAMLFDAASGERLDGLGKRGVRVSKMDCADSGNYETDLCRRGLTGEHVREALILASKVAGAEEVVAELCWSDDPDYVTGYVASSSRGYKRIPVMKAMGSPVGGRIFFVKPGAEIDNLCVYLQNQAVLITLGGEENV